jgi:hypothetical protein
MNYKIKNHTKESVSGVVKREIVTIEVTYANGSTSDHNFVLEEGETVKEAAIRGAAVLEKVLVEPEEVEVEEVEVLGKDQEVKRVDIEAKLTTEEEVSK